MERAVCYPKTRPIPIIRNKVTAYSSGSSNQMTQGDDDDDFSSCDFLFSTKDEHYNAATWRMYHRIIQHRQQQQQETHHDDNSSGAVPITSSYCYYDSVTSIKMRERKVSMQHDMTSSVDGIFSLEL
eukprot:scaffold16630_cov177-Amphora_coffeaeformis.AAC.16